MVFPSNSYVGQTYHAASLGGGTSGKELRRNMEQHSLKQTQVFGVCNVNVRLSLRAPCLLMWGCPLQPMAAWSAGNVPLFIITILYGRWGALAGGLGIALFDVVGGWFLWAPLYVGYCGPYGIYRRCYLRKNQSFMAYVLALPACTIRSSAIPRCKREYYGNWIAPLVSVPAIW